MEIKKAAVIGAGVMGSGIAAQFANTGVEVELLDIVPDDATDRDVIAAGALKKMLKTNPAPLMHKKFARRIRPGNIEDHLERLKECDIIVEVVIERLDIKKSLYQKIDPFRKPGAIIASNTSTIPLETLTEGQSDDFKKHFMVTHFFNPPRYQALLELITSAHNDPDAIARLETFMDVRMGKTVVHCHDTPGFIANRIGSFWVQCAIGEAFAHDIGVEEADAVMSRPIGVPKSGVFGLVDLVGLDLIPHVCKSMLDKLPDTDEFAKIYQSFPVIEQMITDGYIGRKGKGGFYRLDDKRNKLVMSLKTGATSPARRPKPAAVKASKKQGLRALIEHDSPEGRYAWSVLKQVFLYVLNHTQDIAPHIVAVDEAMKKGYLWKRGPFELLDKLGINYFIRRLEDEGAEVPKLLKAAQGKTFYRVHQGRLQYLTYDGSYADIKRPNGVILLADIKRASKPVAKNWSAALWDIGDGVLCLEFTSTMNTLDYFIMRMVHKACDMIEAGKYKALVIHNDGPDFSVGANIGVALYTAKLRLYFLVAYLVKQGQDAYKRLKYAKFPVVSAPSGKALGGACELLMHSHHVQAHAETYPGLVEVGVGILPAWGGCTELLTRAFRNPKMPGGPMPKVSKVFETIATAKVGLSAYEAKDLMYLRDRDGVTMNKDRLLADAKAKALSMLDTHQVEEPLMMELPGSGGLAALRLAVDGFYLRGLATTYDVVVCDQIARVLTGGEKAGPNTAVSQDYLRMLERKEFMSLARDKRTVARIKAILKTGKPLREPHEKDKTAADLRLTGKRKSCSCPLTRWLCGKSCKADIVELSRAKMNWPTLPNES